MDTECTCIWEYSDPGTQIIHLVNMLKRATVSQWNCHYHAELSVGFGERQARLFYFRKDSA